MYGTDLALRTDCHGNTGSHWDVGRCTQLCCNACISLSDTKCIKYTRPCIWLTTAVLMYVTMMLHIIESQSLAFLLSSYTSIFVIICVLNIIAGGNSPPRWAKARQVVLFVCIPHDTELSNHRGAEHQGAPYTRPGRHIARVWSSLWTTAATGRLVSTFWFCQFVVSYYKCHLIVC